MHIPPVSVLEAVIDQLQQDTLDQRRQINQEIAEFLQLGSTRLQRLRRCPALQFLSEMERGYILGLATAQLLRETLVEHDAGQVPS